MTINPRILLAAIFVLALAIRLRAIGATSIWLDEAVTLDQVRWSFSTMIEKTALDNYPPGYNFFAWFSVHWLGRSELALRLPAAIFGALTVPVIYGLVRTLGGGLFASIVGAALYAVAPMDVVYSQDARMYTMLAFGSALYLLTMLLLLQRPGWTTATFGAVAGGLLAYSHIFGLFALLSIGAGTMAAALLVQRRAITWLLASAAGTFLLFVPWLPILLAKAEKLSAGFWIADPSLIRIRDAIARVLGGGLLAWPLVGLWIAAASKPQAAYLPVLALLLGPLVTTLVLFTVTGTSLLLDRYLIASLPAAVVFAAAGIDRLEAIRGPLAMAAAIGVAVIALPSLVVARDAHADDWRGLVRQLSFDMTDDDCLIVDPGYHILPMRFYRSALPECTFRGAETVDVPLPVRVFLVTKMGEPSRQQLIDRLPNGPWSARSRTFGQLTYSILTRGR